MTFTTQPIYTTFARWAGALILVSGSLLGCSSHPDSLHLDYLRTELVESRTYWQNRAPGEHAISIVFEGRAPFAAIRVDGRLDQFRCQLFDDTNHPFAEMAFGRTYFEGPVAKPDQVTGLTPVGDTNEERYRYRAIVYPGLKEKSQVNGPFDIDLLRDRYDHIGCQLVGVQMFGPFIWSNEFTLPKSAVLTLAAASVPAR